MTQIFGYLRAISGIALTCAMLVVGNGCAGQLQARREPAPIDNDPIEEQQLVASFEKARIQAEFQAARDQIPLGNLKVAEENLQTLLRRIPDHRGARMLLAELYATTDRPTLALPLLDQVLAAHQANAATYHLRGMVLQDMGRPIDALDSLHRAVELEPDNQLYRASFEMVLEGE